MRLSKALAWYVDGKGAWELRISDRVYGHLIMGLRHWYLYRPDEDDVAFKSMVEFNRWADGIYTTGLLESAA